MNFYFYFKYKFIIDSIKGIVNTNPVANLNNSNPFLKNNSSDDYEDN